MVEAEKEREQTSGGACPRWPQLCDQQDGLREAAGIAGFLRGSGGGAGRGGGVSWGAAERIPRLPHLLFLRAGPP